MLKSFKLLPKQKAFIEIGHAHQTDVALYQGGVGSGKTTAGVMLGYLLSRLFPKSRGLVGAQTYTLLADTTRQKWEEIVPKQDIEKWTRTPDNLRLKNGSEIWFRHLSDPGRVLSTEFNWIHVEEGSLVSPAVFKMLLARLRHTGFERISNALPKRFRLFITTNPEEEFGWLYETFIEPKQRRENFRFIRAPTAENVFLLERKPDYIETMRALIDAPYADIYLEGKTGSLLSGRIYRNFDRSVHVTESAVYDEAMPIHASFDFNVDFMVALMIQETRQDVTLVVDEVVIQGGSDTSALCAEILARFGEHKAGFIVHGDATGYARHHRSLHSDYAIIKQSLGRLPNFRIKVKPKSANPSIRDRTNAVNFRLENGLKQNRLFVAPHCEFLINSLERSRFEENGFEKLKVRDPKDPRFIIDHAGDALDYYIADEHPFTKERMSVVHYN